MLTACADDGAAYEKKTSKAMCDELGDLDYMRAYVEEQGEGKPAEGMGFFGGNFGGGAPAFFQLLREWREKGDLAGLELR